LFVKRIKVHILVIVILISSFTFIFFYKNLNFSYIETIEQKNLHNSAQISETKQWLVNPNFTTPIEPNWFWKNGTEGDNSDVIAITSENEAKLRILGETRTYSGISGIVNSSSSPGWVIFNNSGFLPPDFSGIDQDGCLVYHHWDETAGGDSQIHNYPSTHFRKNVSLGVDMSEYFIKSASLGVDFNASVDANIDTPNDNYTGENDEDLYAIGDFATFYVLISDIEFEHSYTIAYNRTKYLGQSGAGLQSILSISTKLMDTVNEEDLITALNAVLLKDPDHSNFTITLGLDIYSEDNDQSGDHDDWDSLRILNCNFSFTYEKKIDQFTTVSWNQIGNSINGTNHQITEAKFNFQYKLDQTWPSSAPLSELRIFINNKTFEQGTIKLSSANTTFQDLKAGGIDVTGLISTDVNISISIQLYLKDNFNLDENLTISIDNAYLNISYIKSFPDFQTDLSVFLNGDDKTLDPSITVAEGTNLSINVEFREKINGTHITNATVQLEGKVSGNLIENFTLQHYSIEVNVSQLGLGTRLLTINALKDNYESSNYQFLVKVIERETELQLFLNGFQKNANSSTTIEIDQNINVSIFYNDNITKNHLSGASVNLLGIGVLNESFNHYNITLDSNNLEKGTNILTILAQIDNYRSKSIQFYIEVVDVSTRLQILLNNEDKTIDPVIELPIGAILNITVNYLQNQTGLPINNSLVQMIGEGISPYLTEDPILKHFYIIFNTSSLGLGIKLFSIIAQATNYQIQPIDIRITINRISTTIRTESGESYIDAHSGDNVPLNVILNNTDFGGMINGASVTYRWDRGQGELTDQDSNGIYESVLNNVPAGTYVIFITAFAGDDFEFETYEITLSVTQTPGVNLTWLIIGLTGGIVSLAIAITLYQTHFKYPPMVRKIRKLRKSIKKGRKVKSLILKDRERILMDYSLKTKPVLDVKPDTPEKAIIVDKIDKNIKEFKKNGGSNL
jgi:hypothetical protein